MPCRQEDEFRLRPEALKAAITPKTKLLIMPFPNNPTGAVMEREDLEAIAEVLRDTNVMVLSDEIYAELNYGLRPHVSIATLPGMAERTIVVNGFSKSYAMTGWRLGYACGPAPHHQNYDQDPPERHYERPPPPASMRPSPPCGSATVRSTRCGTSTTCAAAWWCTA